MASSSDSELVADMGREDFNSLQTRLIFDILKATEDAGVVWKGIADEQQLCSIMIIKQTFLSDRFREFHQIWQDLLRYPEPISLFNFNVVDRRLRGINLELIAMEQRAKGISNYLMDRTAKFNAEMQRLHYANNLCLDAVNLEQLGAVQVPNFNELVSPCPDIKELSKDWNEADLDTQLNICLEVLQELQNCNQGDENSDMIQ